jgi:cytochrome c-type biogenesis protein CcmE
MKNNRLLILSVLFLVLIVPSVMAVTLGEFLAKFSEGVAWYQANPMFLDALLIFSFFLAVVQYGLKKAWKDGGRLGTTIAVIFSIAMTAGIIFYMIENNVAMLGNSTAVNLMILGTFIAVIVTILVKTFPEHMASIGFSTFFIVHFLLINNVKFYSDFMDKDGVVQPLIWIVVVISGIFLAMGIFGLVAKAFGKGAAAVTSGKLRSEKEMEAERTLEKQKDRRTARKVERGSLALLNKEASTIQDAKKVLSEIINDLAGATGAGNYKSIRKKIKNLKKLVEGIGAYVGIAANLAVKAEKIPSLERKYKSRLTAAESQIILLVPEMNNSVALLVEHCRGETLNATEAKTVAESMNNQFTKVLKWSERVIGYEREITAKIEEGHE